MRIVVPYPPGGGTDVLARLVGRYLGESLHQPVVVENRPGGNSLIGMDFVAKSAPDGHTLMVVAAGPLDSVQLPRFAPVEPAKALETFQVKKGFRLELVAAEPLVTSPVTMAFDENGKLYVVEMVDYSERRDETPHLGRIRLLEDTDGDGRSEEHTSELQSH